MLYEKALIESGGEHTGDWLILAGRLHSVFNEPHRSIMVQWKRPGPSSFPVQRDFPHRLVILACAWVCEVTEHCYSTAVLAQVQAFEKPARKSPQMMIHFQQPPMTCVSFQYLSYFCKRCWCIKFSAAEQHQTSVKCFYYDIVPSWTRSSRKINILRVDRCVGPRHCFYKTWPSY